MDAWGDHSYATVSPGRSEFLGSTAFTQGHNVIAVRFSRRVIPTLYAVGAAFARAGFPRASLRVFPETS